MRLDLAELARSRWLVFCAVAYLALGLGFVAAARHESEVLGFTGMGRALFSFSHALLVLLPLLALGVTVQTVAQARDGGGLEFWFSQPLSRVLYFGALTLSRWAALAAPLVLLLTGMALVGRWRFGETGVWGFWIRAVGVCLSLLWAFTGAGLWIAVRARSQASALVGMLIAWALGVAFLDFALIGALLAWNLPPAVVFALAALNPVEAARLALLSSADPTLAALGPAGFFLYTAFGPRLLLTLGLVWPALVGVLTWRLGLARFRDGDLV